MTIPAPTSVLSANDARVLNALFDPETLPSSVAKSKDATTAIDSSLPPHATIPAAQLARLEAQQHDIVRRIGVSSCSCSAAEIDAALANVNQVVETWPNYASAYVNRAMLLRVKWEKEKALLSAAATQHVFPHSSQVEPLVSDLSRAIHLALPAKSSPTAPPVSTYQARILRTAYSHRAYLYLKAAETGTAWHGLDKSELEELASRDFAGAARYGDEVAREMSVRTNPYAKMCGAIVRNALKEEMERAQKEQME
ncbi:hypothetical protein ACEQ8H_000531 [Pleosporales sp. CAS-2024a]